MDEKKHKQDLLNALYKQYQNCAMCPLWTLGRTTIVFGEGDPNADLMLIGEAPGKDEDAQGRPFVGRSGKLLTKTLSALGIGREQVYIANIVKCRPPNNRAPLPNELSVCKKILLEKQIEIIRPKVICSLGACSANTLLEKKLPITKIRGTVHSFQGITLIPTFHPAYILRNPKEHTKMTQDLGLALSLSKTIFKNTKKHAQITF